MPALVPTSAPRPLPIPALAPRPIPLPKRRDGELVFRDEPKETNPEEQIKKLALKNAPPWLISTLIHMLVMIILGLWLLPNDKNKNSIFLDVGDFPEGEQLEDASFTLPNEKHDAESDRFVLNELERVDDPFSAPPKLDVSLAGESAQVDLTAPAVGLLFQGREVGSTKDALLGAFGAPGGSEGAVIKGLQWLAKQQRKDGSWSLRGPFSSPYLDADIPESATAMALLSFQGAGSTHRKGPFKKQVAGGLNALLEFQQNDGNFFDEQAGKRNNSWLYTHAQCTIAICELYGMTKDPALRQPAERAVRFCVEAQDLDLGGWRYSPRTNSDTSVTGWMVIALQTAKEAGLEVPSPTLERVSDYLDLVTSDGSRYGYQPGYEPTVAMTAEALLCRQFLGWKQDDPRLVDGAEYLLKRLPTWEDRDMY
ncbi:MAG TPA: prenyltransferase/squalene oxidase repeat-containing protein, partial [Pirellulales bacterium]|nr:prenyltransferase/squalene oxidase repeat-containing protein [Pirellulales bacterium]